MKMPDTISRPVFFAVLATAAVPAFAAGPSVAGENLLWLAIILMAARLFSPLAGRLGLPAVLGELLLGVVLGNLGLVGFHYFDRIADNDIIAFMAELGVIILLLQIGLETRLKELVRVGGRATMVAMIGIVLPFALGALVAGPWLVPGAGTNAYLFIGATLAATSVGITGRVFRDLGKLGSREARIVLGAAVIDDVLGLVLLAVVAGLVQAGSVSTAEVSMIIGKAAAFLIIAILVGRRIARRSGMLLARLDAGHSMLFALVLATGLLFAWLAHVIGLAPIIGAFAAGLLFEPVYLRRFDTPPLVRETSPLLERMEYGVREQLRIVLRRHTSRQHEHMMEPVGYFFVPIFFVLTGMQVDLRTMADPQTLGAAAALTVLAIIGKVACGFVAGRGANPWVVGWGMVPRGEVGLIFAMVGRQLGVVDESVFSVIVIMVIFTTLATPTMLTRLLRHSKPEP